ncbi:MAG: hypothetical protein CEE40_07960 [Chloroflexi bacterium B3_Chlor]|nr:MAG: hypothetical protein CEE40_07960 [Chloroflexi bacterium B3_Chlor]
MTRLRTLVLTLLIIAIIVPVLAACGTGGVGTVTVSGTQALQTQVVPVEGGGSYTDVNAAGLGSMLESKDFPLINVHVPYEGEIDGTDLLVPYDEIELNLDKLPADKGAKLVVYCRSGGMSAIAARTLVNLGYTHVWNLDGGMIAWTEAGYPLVDEGR